MASAVPSSQGHDSSGVHAGQTSRPRDGERVKSILDETYNRRTGAERTNDAVKNCGPGRESARGRVHTQTEVLLALCLQIVVAVTNYGRGNEPGCEKL